MPARTSERTRKLSKTFACILATYIASFVTIVSVTNILKNNGGSPLYQKVPPLPSMRGNLKNPQNFQKQENDTRGAASPKTPIIIVPGALGSILEAKLSKEKTVSWLCKKKSDWFTIFITVQQTLNLRCLFDNMKLRYQRADGTSLDSAGVQVRVPHYGDSVEGVRCILPLMCETTRNWLYVINSLEDKGYVVGKDLFSAPFDFRKGPHDFFREAFPKLKTLTEQVYRDTGNQPVSYGSLSIGGQFLHTFFTHFVDQHWKDKYVQKWLSLSSTFNGYPQAFQIAVLGRDYFLTIENIPKKDLRDIYGSWPSTAWLIPKILQPEDANRIILITPSRNYTFSDIPSLLGKDLSIMYKRSIMYNATADPGVKTLCWHGTGVDTDVAYKLKQDLSEDVDLADIEMERVIGPGDDAAPDYSLSICKKWPSATVKKLPRACHSCLIRRKKWSKWVAEYLTRPVS